MFALILNMKQIFLLFILIFSIPTVSYSDGRQCALLFKTELAQYQSKKSRSKTTGRIIHEAGLVTLQHKTTISNLIGILKTGSLQSFKHQSSGSIVDLSGRPISKSSGTAQVDANFAEIFLSGSLGNVRELRQPIVVFSPNLLNRKDFYYNTGWDHGNMDLGSNLGPKSTYLVEELPSLIKDNKLTESGEFVFSSRPIALKDHGVEILIPKAMWPKIQELARINGIDLNNISIPIRVTDTTPDYRNTEMKLDQLPESIGSMRDFPRSTREYYDNFQKLYDKVENTPLVQILINAVDPKISREERIIYTRKIISVGLNYTNPKKLVLLVQYLKKYSTHENFIEEAITILLEKNVERLDLSAYARELEPIIVTNFIESRNWKLTNINKILDALNLRGSLSDFSLEKIAEVILSADTNSIFLFEVRDLASRQQNELLAEIIKKINKNPSENWNGQYTRLLQVFPAKALTDLNQHQNDKLIRKILDPLKIAAKQSSEKFNHEIDILNNQVRYGQNTITTGQLRIILNGIFELPQTSKSFELQIDILTKIVKENELNSSRSEITRFLTNLLTTIRQNKLHKINYPHTIIMPISRYRYDNYLKLLELLRADLEFEAIIQKNPDLLNNS